MEKKFRKRKRERSGKRAGRSAEPEVMYGFAWGYDFFEFLEGKRKPFSAEGNRPRGRLEKGCPRLCVQPEQPIDLNPKNEQKTGEKSSAWWSMAVAAWIACARPKEGVGG